MAKLAGKTITKVEAAEYDNLSDGESVDEIYRITFADGNILYLVVEAGDCPQYSTIGEVAANGNGNYNFGCYGNSGKFIKQFHEIKEGEEYDD